MTSSSQVRLLKIATVPASHTDPAGRQLKFAYETVITGMQPNNPDTPLDPKVQAALDKVADAIGIRHIRGFVSRKTKRLIFGMGILFGWFGLYAQSLPNLTPVPNVAGAVKIDSPGEQQLLPGALPGVPDGDPDVLHCLATTKIRIAANPSTVQLGQSSSLKWSVDLPDGCDAAFQVKLNGQVVGTSEDRTIRPSRNTRFTLVVNAGPLGGHAQRVASTEVQVGFPERVVIDGMTPAPVAVLLGALVDSNNPVQVVELCSVDLDLTGQSQIVIGANRSLIASPSCARGPRSFGPRIFVTDKRNGSTPLFVIRDSNVRFSGFRLEGPTSGIGSDDDNKEMGIQIAPFASPGLIHGIEISNMEMSHWSGAAISVSDNTEIEERGRLTNESVNAVRIKGNFLHHNRHYDGEGYGVVVGDGGYALIEQNVFEENRHAIAGGSSNGKKDYSGYTARDNLILPGGGLHCNTSIPFDLGCWHTHQIDMHGDQSTLLGGDWCCGTAGETMIIERNTILYTSGYAIKIRGNPADKAVVDGNVFKHTSRGDAIAQNGNPGFGDNITDPIDVRSNNVFGSDPTTKLGSCDFAGDGQQDDFMATGVTWWAKSPTTRQWRYLNTMRERLPEIQLGRVDPDAVCDVALPDTNPLLARVLLYSESGTGPWVRPFHDTAP